MAVASIERVLIDEILLQPCTIDGRERCRRGMEGWEEEEKEERRRGKGEKIWGEIGLRQVGRGRLAAGSSSSRAVSRGARRKQR